MSSINEMISDIKTVFFKELREALRDLKTIIIMFIFPMILIPLLIIGGGVMTMVIINQQEEKITKVGIRGFMGDENKTYTQLNDEEIADLRTFIEEEVNISTYLCPVRIFLWNSAEELEKNCLLYLLIAVY